MKKITYYFLMIIGAFAIISGVYQMLKGQHLSIYYYSILIGFVLMGTTYFNHQRKNNK
ncbi:hypothetical protein [Polaribacter sp. R77954]|uniref:hypothetical protein n=1 Tax=Polaribacter sp. R77954 TaxID=3093870 RepID=UPI0037C989CA